MGSVGTPPPRKTDSLSCPAPEKPMSTLSSGVSTVLNATPQPFKTNAMVEGVKSVNEFAGNSLAAIFELMEMEPQGAGLDNPMFTDNGHEGESPNTTRYFRYKKSLKIASTIITNLGDLDGISSGIEGATYGLMWYKLNALFSKLVPPSRQAKKVEYAGWFDWTVKKKAVPSGSLETMMTAIIRQKMYGRQPVSPRRASLGARVASRAIW